MPNVVLPKEIAYNQSLPTLPSGVQSYEQYILPSNGSSFATATGGQIIAFDLPQRGMLVPSSLYLTYHYTVTNTAANTSSIIGVPVYAPIQKLETIFGSQVVESQNNYSQIMNMVTNLTMDTSMKFGMENAFGFVNNTTQSPATGIFNGRTCVTNESGSFAAPLPCLLSSADKYIPLGLMPNVRVQLTLDRLANFMSASGANEVPTNFTLTNVTLAYTMLDFGEEVMDSIRRMGEKLYIKSHSFTNSANSVSLAGTGYMEVVFATRLASIKSLFLACPINTNGTNLNFDSFDPTNGGQISFSVAGKQYPQKFLDCANNKTQVYMELKKAVGSIYAPDNNFSISAFEFVQTALGAQTTASTIAAPAKFYVGVNTELLPRGSGDVLLTGISSQNSPITVRLNIAASSGAGITGSLTLMCLYDALIEIIPDEKQASVKQ